MRDALRFDLLRRLHPIALARRASNRRVAVRRSIASTAVAELLRLGVQPVAEGLESRVRARAFRIDEVVRVACAHALGEQHDEAAAFDHEPWSHSGASRPPVVTSHFPADGTVITAHAVRVTFSISEAVEAARIGDGCIEVEGAETGVVPGRVAYQADRWWITWETDAELPRDDEFRVTLFADCVADLRGAPLSANESFNFRTAP